ncbi:MAG TPA: HemK/PrmC family methyltransferase [Acidimicrobiales bacterium]|nr:HemK/PrmC family methyltransferase [Acidimicrobiales bacterium]
MDPSDVVAALERAGCVAAREEAAELLAAASERGVDVAALVDRRVTGEPLAWITGWTTFCGRRVRVDPGVYVPRWDTEAMARVAIDALPDDGVAVDLCTGSGAIAAVLAAHHPDATIVATDIDPAAVACARANGVDARLGDLDAPIPDNLRGAVDVVTAVVPYVPTESLHLLPRDTLAFEPRRALDGGRGGVDVLARVVQASTRWLRPGGTMVLELGGGQATSTAQLLRDAGFDEVTVVVDDEGDERAISARYRPRAGRGGR